MASKLLFIDSSVPEREILIENISENVKIVNDSNSLKDIDLNNIRNIGFVWKNYWIGTVKPRFPDFNYPVERPVGNQQGNDNELVLERKTIKEIAGNFPKLQNIDLITCDLNEDGEWKDAFDELKDGLFVNIDGEDVSVNVRYSIDRTGSATLQGDWILESHNVNILDEYFAGNEFVYNHHLAPSPFTSLEDFVNDHSELSITGNTLNLNGDINIEGATWKTLIINETDTIAIGMGTLTAPAGNYNINCIDGNGYTITFTGTGNTGLLSLESLFFNGTGLINAINLREIVIKNLIVDGDDSNSFKGIVYSESGCPAQQVVVKNCGVKNLQINDGYGAIFGQYAGSGQDNYVKAIACYSTGDITTNIDFNGSGGIYGSFAGSVLGSAYAITCYSTGNITTLSGQFNGSGGIYGSFAGDGGFTQNVGGLAYAIACYSTGIISTDGCRNGCGGIFGSQAAVNNGSAYTIACYSTGDIITNNTNNSFEDNGCGGIYGSGVGAGGLVYAVACYSNGDITTNTGIFNGSGGIYGSNAGISSGEAYAIACYSTGEVTATGGFNNGCGGIYGSNAGDIGGEAYAVGCYSTGKVTTTDGSNNGSGGIYGSNTGPSNGCKYAVACYSTGGIGNTDTSVSGYLFGTTNLVIINAVETFAITTANWQKYVSGSGNGESYDPLTPPITPEEDLFYYDPTNPELKNQLELRFFRSLPWDPRSPIPQRPFLLDWSTCDFKKVFYDNWFETTDAWYINNYDFSDPVDIIWARKLLTNLDNSNTLDTFMPSPDYNPVNTIILGEIAFDDIQLYDMVYVASSGTIVQVTDLSGNMVNGIDPNIEDFYRVNTQFPINSEFNDNMDITDPFLKNFICVEDYNIAKRNWNGFNICKTSPVKWVTIEGCMYGNRRF